MPRNRKLTEIFQEDFEGERKGALHAMAHAIHMINSGLLTRAEADALDRLFARKFLETSSVAETDDLKGRGHYDMIEAQCGDDDANTSAECHAAGIKVIAHFYGSAAQAGIIDPEEALTAIQQYVDLDLDPESDDAEGAVGGVMDVIRGGRPLRLRGERARMSNDEVDRALDGIKDRRGDPMMRRVRDKGPSNEEVEAFLDQARDARGRPMFPRR
jgi:hypothetical protein